ncbi:nitrate- and nitrite sensing domain-containing protein [Kitasatospora purpeofusca]|uniref:nitrate- and nitrite sensing domain-containing protein n=1 Tax=Kitasatospora purpeofusca TaxID=67352 RepID=UPI0022510FE4|nr:nitrate- and nitrite sensing domain-containing protein [Kitasatospora purpeofusca]MCX4756751.1 nitrate- and nitrite sensing domain-containing protein [Kitasatospora purpeofusca]WSR35464.1 nitrate- and nitrite sensing domain-containing protein [Kitasatospora purpeofusca]
MRLRSSSIRAKIIALLLVPIVALTALWAYATLATTGDVWSRLDVSATYKEFGTPVDLYAHDLQNERRAAVRRLADPASRAARDAFEQARAATDHDLAVLQQKKDTEGSRLDEAQRGRYLQILAAADQLSPLRAQIGRAALNWEFALGQYTDLIKPTFGFRSAFVARQSGQLPRQGTIMIELMRAREYLAQEDAAMEGLRTGTGRPTSEQYQVALDALHNQQALFTVYIAELDPVDQADYIALRGGEAWAALARAEADFVGAGGPERVVQAINGDAWRETADRALGDLAAINARLSGTIDDRDHSYAVGLLWRGGIAGAIGLVAVVLSVLISFRIGRGLVRELIGLRNAANELAGTRLPSVMLRLRKGESVDVATEAPELEFGQAEIGQVGRAINAVQRAAVEAAVEQAELRRGVSAVFVNLARRSQVLLHRQLTLLDTMERRAEDPAELEDLFKVDHLTTRMRRHAEGLIILAGGSPGRAWRKPVRMVDVVRAAVGEVEDYARVIVRPFPGTGLLGSAVADVTHLIAELVENAAVFSPPSTQVTVQGEVVAHGFALEIDDRGLGLSEQLLAGINERLAVEQEFDLADTDRLGLFVVSRLARRHGIRVHLRPSPYGGTTAVVLIPRELLAEAPDGLPEPPAASGPGAGNGNGNGTGPGVAPGPVGGRRAAVGRRGQRDLVAVPALAEDDTHDSLDSRGTNGANSANSAGGASKGVNGAGGRHRIAGGPRPSAPEPARTPGGLPRRARGSGGPVLVAAAAADATGPGTGRHRRADDPDSVGPDPAELRTGPADAAEAGAGAVAADRPVAAAASAAAPAASAPGTADAATPRTATPRTATTGTPGGLPRRVRQASLAPQLRERAAEAAAGRADGPGGSGAPGGGAEPARERSPEEARATFASFQRGFTRGRGTPAARPTAAPTPVPFPVPTVRRALAPAPAPAALPGPSGGEPAPLVRRAPVPPPTRLVRPPRLVAEPDAPAGPLSDGPPEGTAPSARPARPAPHVRRAGPVRPAPSARPAPAEGTDS